MFVRSDKHCYYWLMKGTRARARKGEALRYVLEAIVPLTEANLKFTFQPSAFFRELDRKGRITAETARTTYYRAKNQGLIIVRGSEVALSRTAIRMLGIIPVETLNPGEYVLVSFDVPEEYAFKRRQLRSLLKELKFVQQQKSVWVSRLDYGDMIWELVRDLGLHEYVRIYRAIEK